ncbi:hypothetical protein D9N16_05675 [Lactococcus raffinolactis]|nr:hypothetical protein [Lactococcus raffinolactis]
MGKIKKIFYIIEKFFGTKSILEISIICKKDETERIIASLEKLKCNYIIASVVEDEKIDHPQLTGELNTVDNPNGFILITCLFFLGYVLHLLKIV